MQIFRKFRDEDNGAVTVDWVVLTAAVVGMCVALVSSMQDGAVGLTDGVATYMVNWTF